MKNIKSILAVFGLLIVFSLTASAQKLVLTSTDGGEINVTGITDKVVVLAVGASWLPLSKDQVLITNKLAKKYTGRDVEIFFVMTDSTNAKSKNYASDASIQSFAAKNKLAVRILRDSDGLLTLKRFGIDQLPSFVILDKTGKKSGEVFGGIDPESDLSIPISKVIDGLL